VAEASYYAQRAAQCARGIGLEAASGLAGREIVDLALEESLVLRKPPLEAG
jgi:hypothetical protein